MLKIEIIFTDSVKDAEEFSDILQSLEFIGSSSGEKEGEVYFAGQLVGRWNSK